MKTLTITEQLNGDYFTFYDNALGTILREFQGLEYAQVRESIDDVAGDYGSVYITSKHGRRVVTIQGDLVGNDIFANRRLLLKALRQTGTIKLFKFTTYDDLLLQFEAEITKVLNPYTHKIHTFLIEAMAPDWRLYAQALKSYDVSQTIVQGGASIPAEIPMSIAEPTASESDITNIIENDGNEASDPIFTIHGPGTDFYISNETAGKNFTLSATLNDTDVVVIDVKRRTAIKNGTDNLYSSLTGDLWSVLPGENELRFLISAGLTVDTNLNVAFRDAYSGI